MWCTSRLHTLHVYVDYESKPCLSYDLDLFCPCCFPTPPAHSETNSHSDDIQILQFTLSLVCWLSMRLALSTARATLLARADMQVGEWHDIKRAEMVSDSNVCFCPECAEAEQIARCNDYFG